MEEEEDDGDDDVQKGMPTTCCQRGVPTKCAETCPLNDAEKV